MFFHLWSLQYLQEAPTRALDRAYRRSQLLRQLQIDWIYYLRNEGGRLEHDQGSIYFEALYQEFKWEIDSALWEFRWSSFGYLSLAKLLIDFPRLDQWKESIRFLQLSGQILQSSDPRWIHAISSSEYAYSIQQILWIQAVYQDITKWHATYSTDFSSISISRGRFCPTLRREWSIGFFGKKDANQTQSAYEPLGFVPRSISRTLSRVYFEMREYASGLVLTEFRLARYQAVASLHYLAWLLIVPNLVMLFCHTTIIDPLCRYWWNTGQTKVFVHLLDERIALSNFEQVEQLLWLEFILTNRSLIDGQDWAQTIQSTTIHFMNGYTQNNLDRLTHLCTHTVGFLTTSALLIGGQPRLTILSSWVEEIFYSLSDTMKAFAILLITDISIGFHSPHGWEWLITSLFHEWGLTSNAHITACFVSTFPVLLDSLFKYWLFRHLNRISPSIVVTYHSINE